MIDLVAFFIVGVTIAAFFFAQILGGRRIQQYYRVNFLVLSSSILGVLMGLSLLSMYFFGLIELITFFILLALCELLYFQIVITYILTIFSYVESSISLKIFTLIAQKGKEGITKKELLASYNRNTIVSRRLARFVYGRELQLNKGVYTKKNTVSPFVFREFMLRSFKFLFPVSVQYFSSE